MHQLSIIYIYINYRKEGILGADEGFDQKSIDSFDLNKELNEKSGINETKNPK